MDDQFQASHLHAIKEETKVFREDWCNEQNLLSGQWLMSKREGRKRGLTLKQDDHGRKQNVAEEEEQSSSMDDI